MHSAGIGPPRVAVGGCWCSRCSAADLVQEVDTLVRHPGLRPRTILFLNAHVFCLAGDHPGLHRQLAAARVVAVDGVSMVLAAWALRGAWLPRCMMTVAFDAYVGAQGLAPARALLVGTTRAEAEAAAANLVAHSRHLEVVAAISGYETDETYDRLFRDNAGVDLILLGLGSPRTEELIERATARRPEAVVWHIGAGTIKCWAGTKQRAPGWVGRWGLEWGHRLIHEPHTRGRYLVGLPRFALRVGRLWVRQALGLPMQRPSARPSPIRWERVPPRLPGRVRASPVGSCPLCAPPAASRPPEPRRRLAHHPEF